MERKFSFDDMNFVARSERDGSTLRVGIYDAWDDCRLEANYPATAKGKTKGKGKTKAAATPASSATPPSSSVTPASSYAAEEQAIDDLIAAFKRKVEEGEINLA